MKHVIIDPAGREYPLDGSDGFALLKDVSGREAPPFALDSDPAVGRQGTVLRQVRVEERDVELPIVVQASGREQLRERIRTLTRATNPRRGDSRLRVVYEDGATVDLVGRVAEIVATGNQRSPNHQRARLVWRAFDPYWRGDEIVRDYRVSAPSFFGDEGFPLQLAGATISAVVSEDNAGDADAWPVWMLRGPGVPALANETTGEQVVFEDLTLEPGEELTIDTTPGVKTVQLDGVNIYDQLTLDSALFPLTPGVNELSVDLQDGTDESLVRLRYRPRSLTP